MSAPPLTRRHHQRLRQMFRSAGWPVQDLLEADLLAAGLLAPLREPGAPPRLQVTEAGVAAISAAAQRNRQARSPHEALVTQVAHELVRGGRIAWRGLSLRVALPVTPECDPKPTLDRSLIEQSATNTEAEKMRWVLACPDVFSVRHTSVETYLEPVVHEIKVSRADLLADLARPDKRAAYLQMGGACWYVLGTDARGGPIGGADDVPPECGAMVTADGRLQVLRPAPRRAVARLPFAVWMALARATPVAPPEDDGQLPL